jgi:hypothetical protein
VGVPLGEGVALGVGVPVCAAVPLDETSAPGDDEGEPPMDMVGDDEGPTGVVCEGTGVFVRVLDSDGVLEGEEPDDGVPLRVFENVAEGEQVTERVLVRLAVGVSEGL